jgi:hypothetical protein
MMQGVYLQNAPVIFELVERFRMRHTLISDGVRLILPEGSGIGRGPAQKSTQEHIYMFELDVWTMDKVHVNG